MKVLGPGEDLLDFAVRRCRSEKKQKVERSFPKLLGITKKNNGRGTTKLRHKYFSSLTETHHPTPVVMSRPSPSFILAFTANILLVHRSP